MGTAGGPGIDDLAELHGVPEYDDGGEQVHSGDAIVLAFAGSIPDFTSAVEADGALRSEEHTSELQSLMRNSYAVFCLKKQKQLTTNIRDVHSKQHSTNT